MGVIVVLAFLAVPAITLLVARAVYHRHWTRRVEHQVSARVGVGAFREAEARATYAETTDDGPPIGLQIASISCFMAGQMLVPGALAWALGVLVFLDKAGSQSFIFAAGLLAFPPGAVAAVLVWTAGVRLLRGVRGPADAATRRAFTFTLALNAVLFAGALACVVLRVREYETAYLTIVYAPLSVLQAGFTRAQFLRHRARFLDDAPADPHARAAREPVFIADGAP